MKPTRSARFGINLIADSGHHAVVAQVIESLALGTPLCRMIRLC